MSSIRMLKRKLEKAYTSNKILYDINNWSDKEYEDFDINFLKDLIKSNNKYWYDYIVKENDYTEDQLEAWGCLFE